MSDRTCRNTIIIAPNTLPVQALKNDPDLPRVIFAALNPSVAPLQGVELAVTSGRRAGRNNLVCRLKDNDRKYVIQTSFLLRLAETHYRQFGYKSEVLRIVDGAVNPKRYIF